MRHRTIGLIGGTTPESTVGYYQYLIREYTRRYGDYAFPEILIHSVSFQEFRERGARGEWDRNAEVMAGIFEGLRTAGADFGLMTANTCHLVFDQVTDRTSLPLISIVDVTVEAIAGAGLRAVALLGTLDTMNAPMYPDALRRRGIETLLPDAGERPELSRIIYEELVRGEVKADSKREYLRVVRELKGRGAEGLVLACTEIPLLLGPDDTDLPIFDTLEIHADTALRYAVRETDLVF